MSSAIGIAIARKRQQDGDLVREGQPLTTTKHEESKAPPPHPPTKEEDDDDNIHHQHQQQEESFASKGSSSYQKPVSSSRLFVAGSLLYGACVLLPAAIGILLRKYEQHAAAVALAEMEGRAAPDLWNDLPDTLTDYMCRFHATVLEYLYLDNGTDPENAYRLSFCAQFHPTTSGTRSTFWSPDTAWTDLAVVALWSLTLATIRFGITRLLVPLKDPERVEAMVKCKSVHLLSRDYQLTPVALKKKTISSLSSKNSLTSGGLDQLKLPHLESSSSTNNNPDQQQEDAQQSLLNRKKAEEASFAEDDMSDVGLHLDLSENDVPSAETIFRDAPMLPLTPPPATSTSNKAPLVTPLPPPPPPPEEDTELDDADLEVLRYNAAAVEATTSGSRPSTPGHGPRNASQQQQSTDRLHAAPRMATAIFRICYSVVATILALWYFRTADFWPWYVWGQGSTQNCWDLSGSLAVVGGMDGDFDRRNTVLRRYFLWQASYHWHAGAFHIFSSLWLWLLRWRKRPSNKKKNKKPNSSSDQDKSWMFYYFSGTHSRSLAQHSLALFLIGTSYVFSSLRRLGAMGMFAFDFSSIFLHLLQLCVNSKEDSSWHNARRIRFIRNVLVLPSFVICRFGIWPALWWSAATESTNWLKQLEMTLFPGAALVLQCVWHSSMICFMILNLVYLERLLNHPHLQRILQAKT